ncbi:MAG: hypothetical protein ACSHXF_04725 [Aquaticitalea sp.]
MRRPYKHLPIYKKAEEIAKLVDSMTGFVEDYEFNIEYDFDQEMVDRSIASMQDKSLKMRMTIEETCWEECQYHDAMEKAVLVKYFVNEIVCDVNRLESAGLRESDFVDVFHDTLEEFRLLFIDWIKTFNKWRYFKYDLDWGLFDLNADVVVVNFYTGEQYDEDELMHRMMHRDEAYEFADEDEDEDEDDFEDGDEDEFEDEDDEV